MVFFWRKFYIFCAFDWILNFSSRILQRCIWSYTYSIKILNNSSQNTFQKISRYAFFSFYIKKLFTDNILKTLIKFYRPVKEKFPLFIRESKKHRKAFWKFQQTVILMVILYIFFVTKRILFSYRARKNFTNQGIKKDWITFS